MPVAHTDGGEIYYETAGEGDLVAFVGDAGYGPWLWSWQFASIAGPFEALTMALRGTDGSDAAADPTSVDDLAADLETVLRARDAPRAHLVGAGLGAMVVLRYAREFGRARSLVLIGGAATGEAVDADALRALHPAPTDEAALRNSLEGAFTPAFRGARPDLVETVVRWRETEDATPAVTAAHLAAMRAFDAGSLYEFGLPALVLAGLDDPVTPASAGEALAEGLPYARFEAVEGRRLCFVEHSAAVNDELLAFWEGV
jgi:3-oxoadipate enol-lactonase